MRCISQYRNFNGPTLQNHREMVLATGDKQVVQQGFSAGPFVHGDVTEWEHEIALKHWKGQLRGLTENEDARWRLSSFDTEDAAKRFGWTSDEKAKFEQVLRDHAGTDYIIVDKPRLAAPWPTYDKQTSVVGKRTIELVVAKVTETVLDLGLDPEDVIRYERDNANRAEVISALESLKPRGEDEPEPLIAA